MLIHPTVSKLEQMRLGGMATALRNQLEMPDIEAMSFMDRLGLMVDHEEAVREDRRLARRLKDRQTASASLYGGSGLPSVSRTRPAPDASPGHLPMDPTTTECPDYRAHRSRQELRGLCAGPQSLSGKLPSALLPPASPVGNPPDCTR